MDLFKIFLDILFISYGNFIFIISGRHVLGAVTNVNCWVNERSVHSM